MLNAVRPIAVAALACGAAPFASPLLAQTVVTSFPDSTSDYGLIVVGPRVAIGQTFTVPAGGDTTLDAVSMRLDINNSAGGNIRLYIYAMVGNQVTGAPLFRSDPIADPGDAAGTYSLISFTGINASVSTGSGYVLFLSNVEGASGVMGSGLTTLATPTGSAASPFLGNAVSAGFAGGFDSIAGASFSTQPVVGTRDLIVELTFIPVPGAAALLAVGGVFGVRSLRRR